MASRSLGALTLDLLLKTGGFVAGLDAAEAATKRTTDRLKADAAKLAASLRTPLEQYRDSIRAIGAMKIAAPELITPTIQKRAVAEAKAAYEALNPKIQEHNRLMAEGARVTKAMRTPQQIFNAEIAQANKLLNTYDATLKRTAIDQATYNRVVRQSEKDLAAANRGGGGRSALGGRFGIAAVATATAYAGAQAVRQIIAIADEYALLENRIKLVTKSSGELAAVQESLFQVAQRTRQEYAGVAELYVKLALTGNELGASQEDLIKFTEAVGNAITISGTSAQTARGALTQLAQGIGGLTFRAEEFNAVLEGMPELLRAAAKYIDGTGGSLIKLREMVQKGTLGSREAFQGILEAAEELKQRVADLPLTVSTAFTQLQNSIKKAVGTADLSPLVDSIIELKETVEDPEFQRGFIAFVNGVLKLTGWAVRAAAAIGTMTSNLIGAASVYFKVGDPVENLDFQIRHLTEGMAELQALPNKNSALIQAQIKDVREQLLGLAEARKQLINASAPLGSEARTKALSRQPAAEVVAPATVVDTKEAENARKQILDQIQALEQQRDTLGKNAIEVMRYRVTQGDLAETLKKSGLSVTEFQRRFIDLQRTISQGTALEKLKDLNEGLQEQLDAMTEAEILETQGAEAAARYAQTHGDLAKTIREASGIFDDTADAAKTYSDTLATVPSTLSTAITVDTSQALEDVQFLYDRVSGKPLTTTVKVAVDTTALDEAQREAQRNIALKVEEAQRNAIKSANDMVKGLEAQAAATEAVRIEEEQGAVAALNYRIAHGDLKTLFEQLGPLAGEYAEKLRILTAAQEETAHASAAQAASEQYIPDALKAAQHYSLVLEGLAARLKAGTIAQDEYNRATKEAKKDYEDALKAGDDFSAFMDEAQRAAQQSLADFFYDPLKEGLDGMVLGFADAVRKIAANIAAAKLAEKLFEGMEDQIDKVGGGIFSGAGGGFGGILEKIGGLFGIGGGGYQTPGINPGQPLPTVGQVIASGSGVVDPGLGAAVTPLLAETATATAAITTAGTSTATAITTAGTTSATAITTAGTALASAISTVTAQLAASGTASSMGSGLSEILVTAKRIAGGGPIRGPGTGTSDSIPAWVSHGEYVVKAASVQQPGAEAFLHEFNRVGMQALSGLAALKYLPRSTRTPLTRVPMRFAAGGLVGGASAKAVAKSPLVIQQSLTINSPNGQVSRQTEMQITAAAARGVKVADRRNN